MIKWFSDLASGSSQTTSDSITDRVTLPDETPVVWFIKGVIYLMSLCFYLFFFTSPWAFWSALGAGVIALFVSRKLGKKLSIQGLLLSAFLTVFLASLELMNQLKSNSRCYRPLQNNFKHSFNSFW